MFVCTLGDEQWVFWAHEYGRRRRVEDQSSVCATFCHSLDDSEFVKRSVYNEIHALAKKKSLKLPGSTLSCRRNVAQHRTSCRSWYDASRMRCPRRLVQRSRWVNLQAAEPSLRSRSPRGHCLFHLAALSLVWARFSRHQRIGGKPREEDIAASPRRARVQGPLVRDAVLDVYEFDFVDVRSPPHVPNQVRQVVLVSFAPLGTLLCSWQPA